MTVGRPKAPLVLTEDERETLVRWAGRPVTGQGVALRCRIVLACDEGLDNKVVAARLGVHQATVVRWRSRFLARRLGGLSGEPRPGTARSITDDEVRQVILTALEQPPAKGTAWSTHSLARATGLSQTTVSHIWRGFGVRPDPAEATEPDRDVVEKVRDVAGLYLASPDAAVVLCANKTAQTRARTASALLLAPRGAHRNPGGPSSLRAALEVGSRRVLGDRTAQQRALEFRRFLNQIDRSVSAGLDVHVIVNNPSIYKNPDFERWVARLPRFALHFAPTRSSWLDVADRWLNEIAARQGMKGSTAALEEAVRTWASWWHEDLRPFVWHGRADPVSRTGT